jgi:hypothetical protein
MKTIAWENWNEKERDLVDAGNLDSLIGEETENEDQIMQMDELLGPLMGEMRSPVIQTPFGVVTSDSLLKPSDRWDCWLGYTNFDLTNAVSDQIKIIDGIEALKIMSRYTFCIGVGKLFKFNMVRKEIENAVCKQRNKI